jgi:PAS domain S-box-containing protein
MKHNDKAKEKLLNKISSPLKQVAMIPEEQPFRQARDPFNDSKDFCLNIIESSLDGIIAVDEKGNIKRVNQAFLEMLGHEENEVVGKHIAELSMRKVGEYELTTGELIEITRDYFDKQASMIAKLVEGGAIKNRRSYFVCKNGKVVPCEQNISPLYNGEGKVIGAVGIVRNITDRKRSESSVDEIREFLDNVFKTAADGIIVTDPKGYIIMLNDAVERITGYRKEDLIGKHAKELRAKGSVYEDKNKAFFEKLFKEGITAGSDIPWARKDGEIIIVERSIALLKDKKGNIAGAVATIRDITKRIKSQEELREAKEHLDSLIENSLDCIMVSDKTGYITKVNKYFLELFGYSKEEVIGKHVMECTPMIDEGIYECTSGEVIKIGKEFIDDAQNRITDLIEKGKVTNWEAYYFCKEKKVVPIEQNIVCLYNKEGERTGAVAVIRDITLRRKGEKELKETKEFLEKVIESTQDGILIVDEKGYILSSNSSLERMSGFGKNELIGQHASSLIVDDKEIKKAILEKTAELFEKGFATYDAQYKTKDGKCLDVECISSMISNDKGEYIAGVAVLRDISERKRTQREIKEGKEFLEKIIQGSKDGIVISDEMGYILSINEALHEMLDLSKEEIIGKHTSELIIEDQTEKQKMIENMGELFENGCASYETRYTRKDGNHVDIECHSSIIKDDNEKVIAGISIARDITERKRMQQQLMQSEKLRSLGELAGGVAHDFNNVLAAILGRVQLLKMQFKPPYGKKEKRKSILDLTKSLDIIEKASLDGAETVRRIQEFSRKRVDDKDFTQVDINELLDNALDFTRVRWRSEADSKGIKINIEKNYSPLPCTLGSPSELREVFTNLLNNALDAMPGGGIIRIKTFKEDDYIALTIEDTGVGIPEAIRNRIFDPFFTTKGVQSTGLGMSISYGIINRHKGTIAVESVESKGTIFSIKLPIQEMKLKSEEAIKPVETKGRKAKILIIEDEEEVGQLLYDILISRNHEVEVASDGSQGLELFKSRDFDLVFTDLGMPSMSGWQVADEIKHIGKKVPVAIITGWNVALNESEMTDKGVHFIVQKPFQVNQILKLVQEGLELKNKFLAA